MLGSGSEWKLLSHIQLFATPWTIQSKGIFQARILEWVAHPFSRGSSQPGIKPRSPALQADSLPSESPGKPKKMCMQIKPQITSQYPLGACKSLDWCDLTAPSLSRLPTYAEAIHPQTLYSLPKNISTPSNSLHPMATIPSKSKSPETFVGFLQCPLLVSQLLPLASLVHSLHRSQRDVFIKKKHNS